MLRSSSIDELVEKSADQSFLVSKMPMKLVRQASSGALPGWNPGKPERKGETEAERKSNRMSKRERRIIQQLEKKLRREQNRMCDLEKELKKHSASSRVDVISREMVTFMQTDDRLQSYRNPWLSDNVKMSSTRALEGVKNQENTIMDSLVQPLPAKSNLWDIVQNIVVASYETSKFGWVLLHLGRITYATSTQIYRNIDYDPACLKPKGSWKYCLINGGNLPESISFGSSSQQRDMRDRCLEDMVKWGHIWNSCAKNEAEEEETFVINFPVAQHKVGIVKRQGYIKTVIPDSPAEMAGVKVGWRVMGEYKIDDELCSFSFFKVQWPAEIKALIIEGLLSDIFWKESILAACKLTSETFTGWLVERAIKEFLPKVQHRWGKPSKAQFLVKLALVAEDSEMSRAILSSLDENIYGEVFEKIASETKQFFIRAHGFNEVSYVPAVCHILSRLFDLQHKEIPRYQPGHALYVWFRGANLDFLKWIQERIQPEWSTEDVKNELVLKETSRTSAKSLMVDHAKPKQRGPATMFISHTWRNRYHSLVEACAQYPNEYFFNDILSIQQHRVNKEEMQADLESLPHIIRYTGCVLLVSDMMLGPLHRVWCLFELYHCLVETNSRLTIQFTQEGLENDTNSGLWDMASEIEERIANINVADADATVAKDKVMILNEIKTNVEGGIKQFNMQLIAKLKSEWAKNLREQWGWQMMKTLGKSVRKIAKLEKKVNTMENEINLLRSAVSNMASNLKESLPEESKDNEIVSNAIKLAKIV